MTKQELIEALRLMNDDEEIFVAVPTGDYWGHVKIQSVNDALPIAVRYSKYLESLESISDRDVESDDSKFVWALDSRR